MTPPLCPASHVVCRWSEASRRPQLEDGSTRVRPSNEASCRKRCERFKCHWLSHQLIARRLLCGRTHACSAPCHDQWHFTPNSRLVFCSRLHIQSFTFNAANFAPRPTYFKNLSHRVSFGFCAVSILKDRIYPGALCKFLDSAGLHVAWRQMRQRYAKVNTSESSTIRRLFFYQAHTLFAGSYWIFGGSSTDAAL